MTTKTRIAKLETKTPKAPAPVLTDADFISQLEKFLHADPDPKADPGGMYYQRGATALRAVLQGMEKDGER